MNRRTFLGGMAAAGAATAANPAKTNLLFILADQWRWCAFHHADDPNVRTPNFDKLAASGIVWNRAYAANPVCTPNRSCILTGRFSHQHKMSHNDIMLPPSERCIAESFVDAGYATHYIGKWHMDGPARPGFVPSGWRRRGFQTFEGFNRGHLYHEPKSFTNEGKLIEPGVYEPHFQTDLAMQFMQKHQAHPFFCYLSWGPPHTPYRPPKDFDRYDPAKLVRRPNVPEEDRKSPQSGRELAGYYGLIESLDAELGRIVDMLDRTGLRDNTLIVFTSDHGDMHHSHGLLHKGKPEEESLHVPLIMSQPGRIRPGSKTNTLVSSIDYAPTMLSMCGVKGPRTFTGSDLSAAALGGTNPHVDSVYSEGAMRHTADAKAAKEEDTDPDGRRGISDGREWRALVTPTHKLVLRLPGEVAGLFDLEHDPYEMKNLANQSGSKSLQDHLLKQMKDWAKRTGDPFPQFTPPAKPLYSDDEAAHARA